MISDVYFMQTYIIVVILILLSGIFSGLTLGFFTLNLSELERKAKLGDTRAEKVLNVRRNGNLLLCTLLLGNVAVNSCMAIFLSSITSGLAAACISTGLIVIFGEILPQAVFSRYALTVGFYSIWLVKFFRFLLYPIASPLARILDRMLGQEIDTIWSKREIREILRDHKDSPHSTIDADEERIANGALSFSVKSAREVMTPASVVYTLERNKILSRELLEEIRDSGHTRIPLFDKTVDKIASILFVKDLIGCDIEPNVELNKFGRSDSHIVVSESDKLDTVLNSLMQKKVHIALVYDEFGIFNGLVTLEDIIEQILRVEIVDEVDKVSDLQKYAKEQFSEITKNKNP
jgi:metal transporter CNNM